MLKHSRTRLMYVLGSLLVLQGCANSPERSTSDFQSATLASGRQAAKLNDLSEGDSVVFHSGLLSSLGKLTVGREYQAASGRMCKQILSAEGGQQMAVACKSEDKWYVRQALDGIGGRVAVADESAMSIEDAAERRVWDSNKLEKLEKVGAPALELSERSKDKSSRPKDKKTKRAAAMSSGSSSKNSSDEKGSRSKDKSSRPKDKKTKRAAAMSSGSSSKNSSDEKGSYRLEVNETLWSFAKRTTGNALNWEAIAKYNNIVNEQKLRPGTLLRVPKALNRAER